MLIFQQRYVATPPTVVIPPSDVYAFRDPTGSDLFIKPTAVSDGGGTQGSPWKTISSARYASIAPGQALWVMGGGSLNWVDCTNAQSGTSIPGSGSQVVLSGYPGDPIPSIVFTDAVQRVGGSADTRGWYHWWRMVDIQCQNIGPQLANFYTLGGDTLSRYFTISDCTGTRNSISLPSENAGIIGAYGNSSNTLSDASVAPISVVRCSFGMSVASGVDNESLILFENQPWQQVIGCLLNGSANPLYFKHDGGMVGRKGTVKNNIFLSAGRGVQVAADFIDYINNAFFNADLNLDESGGSPGGSNCNILHNTFYNSDVGMSVQSGHECQNNVGRNNVYISGANWMDNPFNALSGVNQNNNTDYSACATGTHFVRNSNSYNRAGYNAAFAQEANGVEGTCALVGGTTPGSTPANWALTGGSVGRGNASDGGDRGVNAANLRTVN